MLLYLNSTTLHHIFLLLPFLNLRILQAEKKTMNQNNAKVSYFLDI